MILPGSYANGFAPRDGQPLYPELWRGCVGAWDPCLGPTGLTLRDWSGFGRHGVLTNMDPGTDWISSDGKYAVDLDGTDDYIGVSTTPITGTLVFSLSCWCRFNGSVVDSMCPMSIGQSSNATNYIAFNTVAASSRYQFAVRNSANNTVDGPASSAVAGVWTHLAGTSNGTNLVIYVNGVPSSPVTLTTTAPSLTRVGIGTRYTTQLLLTLWPGFISDCRVYNKALSANEIRLLAARRGIAYELAPRRRPSVQVAASFNRRRRLLVGAGL